MKSKFMKSKKLLLLVIAAIAVLSIPLYVKLYPQSSHSKKANDTESVAAVDKIELSNDDTAANKDQEVIAYEDDFLSNITTDSKLIDPSFARSYAGAGDIQNEATIQDETNHLDDAIQINNPQSKSTSVIDDDNNCNTLLSKDSSEKAGDNVGIVAVNEENEKTGSIYNDITGEISDIDINETTIVISIADPYVNIRKKPNTDSKILGKLYKGSAAAILDRHKDWVLIKSGTVTGYIKSEFLDETLSKDEMIKEYGILQAKVDVDGLNVRKKKKTKSKRLTVIYSGEIYSVLDVTKKWVKINVEDDNITGYVSKEYVDLIVNYNQAISIEEEKALLRLQEEQKEKKTKQTLSVQSTSGMSYSKDDLKLLACLIHAESGNQPYEGKLAVANVVLNRVKSSSFPNSIKDVIYQSGQFSVVNSGSLTKQLNNYGNYTTRSQKLSIDAALTALDGSNNIGDRLFFNRYTKSKAKSHSNSVRIEGHLFW